jgi:hypothetical protein
MELVATAIRLPNLTTCEHPKINLLACCNHFNFSNKWRKKSYRISLQLTINLIKVFSSHSTSTQRTETVNQIQNLHEMLASTDNFHNKIQ